MKCLGDTPGCNPLPSPCTALTSLLFHLKGKEKKRKGEKEKKVARNKQQKNHHFFPRPFGYKANIPGVQAISLLRSPGPARVASGSPAHLAGTVLGGPWRPA